MHLPSLMRAARRFAASRPEARRFAARAWLCAPPVQASLALVGLRPTLRWIEAAGRGSTPERSATAVGVTEGSALVSGAFRAHVVGGECLPRSLVQYLLHRLDGQPVRFVVGVKRSSGPAGPAGVRATLDAHAWVEAGDETAAEPTFTPLFASGARGPA
jgi:Transglutaminase-like superfamily